METLNVPNGSRRLSSVSASSIAPTGCSHEEQPMLVYCETCSQPLCDICLVGTEHRRHNMKTLADACKDQIDKIEEQLKDVESKTRGQDIHQWVKRQEEQFESEFMRVQDDLTEKYTELQGLLDHSMKQALKLLEAQLDSQKKTLNQQVQDAENFKIQTNKLQANVAKLNERVSSGQRSADVLGEIQAHQISLDTINEFYKMSSLRLNILDRSRVEALEKSIKDVAEMSREMFPRPWEFYQDLTFAKPTENTPKSLTIYDDQVFINPRQVSPNNTHQEEEAQFHILAEQSWKEGQHYWEVDVENCHTWAAGIVEINSGNRFLPQAVQGRLGRDRKSWMLESEEGELAARHNDRLSPVSGRQNVKRLGIYLDMTKDKSRLTFYDVGRNVALHAFDTHFKKSVFPVFSLSSVAGQVQSLALCNLSFSQTRPTLQTSRPSSSAVP